MIGAALEQLFPQTLRHWGTAFRLLWPGNSEKKGGQRRTVLLKVLTGLVLSVPLLLIVLSLLSSADGVFNHWLRELPNLLNQVSFGEGVVRGIWLLLFGLGFFGLIWGFVEPRNYRWDALSPGLQQISAEMGETRETAAFKIDPVIMTTILTVINMVYVLFVFVQFSYLFGAWDGILPHGSSYAEYARRGFFELVMVTGINYVILILSLLPGRDDQGLLHKVWNILLYILVACSGVMLYSAFTRLALYEEAYGYTYTRFLVHAFMIFLGCLLGLAALRIGSRRLPLAKCYIVLGLVAYVVMNYIGMDVLIANKNIERYMTSGNLDADYLSSLSDEAIPVLIEFSHSHNGILDKDLREAWDRSRKEEKHWQSFNVSRYRAAHDLKVYFEAGQH